MTKYREILRLKSKRRNIGRVVNKLQFLHNGNQVVFHYTFILEDNHGQLQSPPPERYG